MMQLIDPKTGMYQSDSWTPDRPGLFAVIIGVSNYPHLDDGSEPAPNTYGFGQLGTSSLTAYDVFCWLRDHYHNDDAPLARCWLLLAPSREEIDLSNSADIRASSSPVLFDSISGRPTFGTCRTAIRAWRDTMLALGHDPDPKSRALFFFSGHGIQATASPLLLPSDWLGPTAPTPNTAIPVTNLTNGLTQVPVLQQWFFSDACRNTNRLLSKLRTLTGTEVLEEFAGEVYDRSYPILFGAAATKEAYEPRDVRERTTYFGAALLDGFRAKDPIVVSNEPRPCVKWDRLVTFVSADTRRRLAAVGVKGGPRQGGEYATDDPTVTYVDGGPPQVLPEAVPPPPSPNTISQKLMSEVLFTADLQMRHIRKSPLDSWLRASAGIRSGQSTDDIERALTNHLDFHQDHPYGSERLTNLFERAHVNWWDEAYGAMRDGEIAYGSVRRTEDAQSLEVSFSIEPRDRDVWLEWRAWEDAGGDGGVFGTLLPKNIAKFTLTASSDDERQLAGLAIFANRGPENDWGQKFDQLYRLYRTLSPLEVTKRLEIELPNVHEGLLRKTRDPLSALEASFVLLRGNLYAALYGDIPGSPVPTGEDWLSNLAEWFPELGSDACVLVAQRLVSDPNGARANEARTKELVGELRTRGLPRTAEARRYLLNLVHLVRVGTVADRVHWIAPILRDVAEILDRAGVNQSSVDSDGLFSLYGAAKDQASVAAYEATKMHHLTWSGRNRPALVH